MASCVSVRSQRIPAVSRWPHEGWTRTSVGIPRPARSWSVWAAVRASVGHVCGRFLWRTPPAAAAYEAAASASALGALMAEAQTMPAPRDSTGPMRVARHGRVFSAWLAQRVGAAGPEVVVECLLNPAFPPSLIGVLLSRTPHEYGSSPERTVVDYLTTLGAHHALPASGNVTAFLLDWLMRPGHVWERSTDLALFLSRPDVGTPELYRIATAPWVGDYADVALGDLLRHRACTLAVAHTVLRHPALTAFGATEVLSRWATVAEDPRARARVLQRFKTPETIAALLPYVSRVDAAQLWANLMRMDRVRAARALGRMSAASLAVLPVTASALLDLLSVDDAEARLGVVAALRALAPVPTARDALTAV
jgi:hypothetical protein